jgi:hypothetical protein
MDVQNSWNDIVYRLGFVSSSEITGTSWLLSTELFQWADDAAKKCAYRAGLFVEWDASIAVTDGTAVYELPSSHVFTIKAWLGTQPLRVTPVRDLWALDANWPTTSGDSQRCSLDAGAVGTITLYPNPIAGGTLQQICQEFPGTVESGSSTLALNVVLQDYFSYKMLEGARGKESDFAMPEMAAHFAQRAALYEQLMDQYWGPGQ